MLKICFENTNLDEEQKKIISDVIEAYEIRGIHLKEKDQNELKKLNEQLTELRRKFSVNVLKSE
jgi:Zn-dependent oligopeptidase